MKRLLFPTDGSETAKGALAFAIDIAKAEGAAIIVLSVAFEPASYGVKEGQIGKTLEWFAEQYVEDARKEIEASGVTASTRVVVGIPHEVIVKMAGDEEVDAIVMGTHGVTGLTRALIGSVADRVIRRAGCPVVLVPRRE